MCPKATVLFVAVALFAAATLANAQTVASTLGRDETLRSVVVRALQDDGQAIADCNREVFRKRRMPNAVTTTAAGIFSAAPSAMADCKPGEPDAFDNVRVTEYGDAALVEGIVSVRRGDGELSAPRRFLALFVKDAGQWKMAASHATLIDVSQTSRAYALFVEHQAPQNAPAVVATSGSSSPVASDRDLSDPDPEQDVLDADAELNEAINTADTQAYRRLVADDMSFVGVDGVVSNLSQRLQMLVKSSPGREIHDVRANAYGKAAVTTAWVRNEDRTLLRYTRIWIQRTGGWQLAATQTSRMAISPVR